MVIVNTLLISAFTLMLFLRTFTINPLPPTYIVYACMNSIVGKMVTLSVKKYIHSLTHSYSRTLLRFENKAMGERVKNYLLNVIATFSVQITWYDHLGLICIIFT